MRKANSNISYIADSMARTFETRTVWVTTGDPEVEIIGRCPALKHRTFISLQQEFIAVTSRTIEDNLVAGPSNSRLRILEAARTEQHLAAFFEDMDSRVRGEGTSLEHGR
ncbi:unnamed protein product, partial [Ixodes hexagonus]